MNPEEIPLKQIRTFQGDVAEALQRQQESLVSIQRREQLKKDSAGPSADISPQISNRRKELFFLSLGSFLLFSISALGAWYAYNEFVKKSSTPIIATPVNRFVSVNTETSLNLATTSRETFINTIADATKDIPDGELRQIVLHISTSDFLKTLESQAPGSLVRAFDPLFMFGVLGKSTFLIIKLTSFENAFAGMLTWEKNLAEDLGPLFTTATLLKEVTPGTVFIDITDRNKDIRALMLGEQPVLLYSFFDNKFLIITDHIETLRTLIDHLTREKLPR